MSVNILQAQKEFKKLSKSYKDISTYVANSEDDFHIKILN